MSRMLDVEMEEAEDDGDAGGEDAAASGSSTGLVAGDAKPAVYG